MADKLMYIVHPIMLIHKITPSVDYNQKTQQLLSQRIIKRYYKTLGSSAIHCPSLSVNFNYNIQI